MGSTIILTFLIIFDITIISIFMNSKNPKVDEFLSNTDKWQQEMVELRKMLLNCGLTEEFKWRQPCYTFNNSNIVILHEFKDYCGLGFFNGVLLKDPQNLLIKPGENTQSARQLRFTNFQDIVSYKTIIMSYIFEAIEAEKAGLKIPLKKTSDYKIPEELLSIFDKDPAFKSTFETLTPGRQRGYLLYFSAPKQSNTRTARIEKYKQRILNRKGIHDCICGHSKKMPNCDGSHKNLRK